MCSTFFIAQATYAENVYSEQFQQIYSVETYHVLKNAKGQEQDILVSKSEVPSFVSSLIKEQKVTKVNIGDVLMMTKKLIALGKEIYKIVKDGKPVVTIKDAKPVEILPRGEKDEVIRALDLSNWHIPRSLKYKVVAKNYLGVETISFEYMLIFSYAGQFEGNGKYITGAIIKPTNVKAKWGYDLNASFKVQTIMNEGSDEDPVAAAVLSLGYEIKSIMSTYTEDKTFYINGLGKVINY